MNARSWVQIEATLDPHISYSGSRKCPDFFQTLPYLFSIKENKISPFLAIYGKWIKTRAFTSATAPEIWILILMPVWPRTHIPYTGQQKFLFFFGAVSGLWNYIRYSTFLRLVRPLRNCDVLKRYIFCKTRCLRLLNGCTFQTENVVWMVGKSAKRDYCTIDYVTS